MPTTVFRLAGSALRAVMAVVLLLRRPRPIHAHGVVFEGDLVLLEGRRASGIRWFDAPPAAAVPVVVRVSRSVGLPPWLPDVWGLGVRWTHDGRDVDLELASTGVGVPGRHVLLPRRSPSRATMSSIFPYRSPQGPVLLAARTMPPRSLPADLDALREAVARHPWVLRLYSASPRGRWHPIGELRLRDPRAGDDPDLRFDIDRKPLPGADSYGWARALRRPSYRLAQGTAVGAGQTRASSTSSTPLSIAENDSTL